MRAEGEPAEEERLLPGPEPCVRHVVITGLWETVPIPQCFSVVFTNCLTVLECQTSNMQAMSLTNRQTDPPATNSPRFFLRPRKGVLG